MRKLLLIVFFASAATQLIAKNTKQKQAPLQRSRTAVLSDYNLNYVGTNTYNLGWTGDVATCNPGTLRKSSFDTIIRRINFFRRMAGYTRPCTLDTTLTPMLQQAALMMHANNVLSHRPDTTLKCYTEEGARGAAGSNLHLGPGSASAIENFMADGGANNTSAGHRRWILQSTAGTFGFGATSKAAALYVFGKPVKQPVPPFVAWPPAGFVPRPLIYDRWSFFIPGATFQKAQVTMSGPDGDVPLRIVSNSGYYGDPGLVWEPAGIRRQSDSDVVYSVTVRHIKNAKDSVYSYQVIVIKP